MERNVVWNERGVRTEDRPVRSGEGGNWWTRHQRATAEHRAQWHAQSGTDWKPGPASTRLLGNRFAGCGGLHPRVVDCIRVRSGHSQRCDDRVLMVVHVPVCLNCGLPTGSVRHLEGQCLVAVEVQMETTAVVGHLVNGLIWDLAPVSSPEAPSIKG